MLEKFHNITTANNLESLPERDTTSPTLVSKEALHKNLYM